MKAIKIISVNLGKVHSKTYSSQKPLGMHLYGTSQNKDNHKNDGYRRL
jgi:hypothetical protein